MISDTKIYEQVTAQLNSMPTFDASHIIVGVKDEIVTLSGGVKSYVDKKLAEEEARKVQGVKAVVDELQIIFGQTPSSDEELADIVLKVLEEDALVPSEHITVLVDHGIVTLRGEVELNTQKERAEEVVRYVKWVRGTINDIIVKPSATQTEAKAAIEKEIMQKFEINPAIDAVHIQVEFDNDGTIKLKGKVRTEAEAEEAEKVAETVPGVKRVENELICFSKDLA